MSAVWCKIPKMAEAPWSLAFGSVGSCSAERVTEKKEMTDRSEGLPLLQNIQQRSLSQSSEMSRVNFGFWFHLLPPLFKP